MDSRLTPRQEGIVQQAREFATDRLIADGRGEQVIALHELCDAHRSVAMPACRFPRPSEVGSSKFSIACSFSSR